MHVRDSCMFSMVLTLSGLYCDGRLVPVIPAGKRASLRSRTSRERGLRVKGDFLA